jgi:hypothetical protein
VGKQENKVLLKWAGLSARRFHLHKSHPTPRQNGQAIGKPSVPGAGQLDADAALISDAPNQVSLKRFFTYQGHRGTGAQGSVHLLVNLFITTYLSNSFFLKRYDPDDPYWSAMHDLCGFHQGGSS